MCEHEATLDICLNLKAVRNLAEDYASRFYFRVWVTAGENLASPYQVIPHSPHSAISLTDYLSPLFTLGPHSSLPLAQLAVFKALLPIASLDSAKLRVSWALVECANQEREIQRIELEYTGVLGVNSYMPVCFTGRRCAVDAILTTQLLSCRFKNILQTPKPLLYAAVEALLITFNRLREKLAKRHQGSGKQGGAKCEYDIESFPEMEDVRRFAKARIFQQGEEERRARLLEFEKRLPRVSFCVQQLWTQYLGCELEADIERYRQSFLRSYSQQVTHSIYNSQNVSQVTIVDGLKLPAYPLTVKTVRKPEGEESEEEAPHIIFLVHGYGACSKTLQQLELGLRFFYPNLYVVSSKINENKTDDSLEEMGRRLALEVQASIEGLALREQPELSFIGHSMGGLIVRVALGLLQRRRFSMRLYVSLGTPHLGHLYHNSRLTKAGIWALSVFKGSSAMSSLLMEAPNNDPRQSLLYQLSQAHGLNWFQQVLFYAGIEDYFVSPESALIESNDNIEEEKRKGVENAVVWQEMRLQLDDTLSGVPVGKYLVDFQKQNEMIEWSIADQLLGRRDHINLTTSSSFVVALLLPHTSLFHSPAHSLASSRTHSSLHDSI